MERKRQYVDEAVASTSTAPEEVPPKRPRESQEISLREMQQSDDEKAEEMERLHLAIKKGDLQSVERIVGNNREEKHFLFGKTSALFKAISCKKYDIAAFLIHVGATIHEPESVKYDRLEKDWDLINHLLYEYNKKIEASCIYRLLSLSQSPQGFNDKQQKALLSMYEHFFESSITKLLMKVLETQDFDIVFDFEGEKVNRLCHWGKEYDESRGLNPINSMEILIGAKHLFSPDIEKRLEVYGVVAEELCHLSMTTVFSNDAKPYFKDAPNIQDFEAIVDALNSMEKSSSLIVSIIQSIFDDYEDCEWDCELIARVPYIIGMWGEEVARAIFKEYEEFSRLLEFYEKNVLPEYKKYTEQSTKSYRMRKELIGENVFISFKEKQIRPLMDPPFTKYVVVEKGVSVISTNSIKLCILHVYHKLKQDSAEHLDRKCLFFGSEYFEKKREVILNALRSKLFEYLVLHVNNKELHHKKLLSKYLVHFKEFQNGGKNIIIISNSQLLGPKFEGNFVEYKWEDLTDEYKDFRLENTKYIFKGDRRSISIKKEDVPTHFSGEDILKLISGDLTEVRDHADLNCQGYNLDTYVERQFYATIIDNNIFKSLPNDSSFLIYGSSDFVSELSIDKRQVQWLKESDDEIKEGKTIFIDNRKRPMNFEDFVEKTAVKNRICLQYYKEVFYLMNSEGDVWKQHQKDIRQTEGEIIDWLKENKTLIISDNAGNGKSTVLSHLIWHVRREIYNSWVLTVDLNKFSIEDEGTDSEEDDDEELFEDIFDMLGLENGFEKCHFKNTYYQENYFIFLDAFDEIQSKYKRKALKLIAFLRKKTDARIIITTRMHHQKELEGILNAFSHQLVPFDNESQVHCLGKLWKWKLKFPTGEGSKLPQKEKKAMSRKIASIIRELEKEKDNLNSHDLILAMKEIKLDDSLDSIRKKIDGLKFSELAKYILNEICLDEETVQFMGIPLHLFMIGSIYFDSNFKLEINSGIYSIYSKFVHLKIRFFVEEKQGISYQGRGKEIIIKRDEIDAYRIHIDLANQLMDKGKIEIINMSKEDKELCAALGIVSIKGEQIDFLHHTFTEYFRAESIRKDLKKDEFIGVLLEDKYEVVRRFLLSSLEENNFENLTKELFEDLEFLFPVLKRFVVECRNVFRYYKSYLKFDTIARIVKCLLECFQNTVDPICLNEFVLALRSELSSFKDWYVIGGCLSVNMMKILFSQSNDYLKLMFSVFKYYSNPTEVIELLSEWISIENSGECDSNERENKKREAESLLKVLKFKNSDGFSLLSYAAFNVRIETFPKLLEFPRNSLGEELFVNEIIGSGEYKETMDYLINYADFNRICGFLKTFHSVFGTEIDIFFYEKLKFSILEKILINELSNEFEEIIQLFKEYFGMEKLKEVLFSCNFYGYYLIHILVKEYKNVIKNLNIVRNILVESSEMKQFLMFKNRVSQNIFHFTALNKNGNFGDLLEFCSKYLEKDDIEEMLTICNEDGENVLHFLLDNNSTERIIKCLDVIRNTLDNDELFKNLLKAEDKEKWNIFHFAAGNKNGNFGEIMKFCGNYLEKHEIVEMLTICDEDGWNLLHSLFRWNSTIGIIECLDVIKNTLDNDELFKNLLKGEDKDKWNIIHFAAKNKNVNFGDLLEFCSKYLEKHEIVEMLTSCDEHGGLNVLHILFNDNSTERIIECLDVIKNTLDNDELFKNILKGENKYKWNIFHYAADKRNANFGDLLEFCGNCLEKDEIVEMLTSCDDEYGLNVLHILFNDNSTERIIEYLDVIKNTLDNDELFKNLLKGEDKDKWNIIHFAAENKNEIDISFLSSHLCENEIKELLIGRDNENGNTILHLAANEDSTNLLNLFEYSFETLKADEGQFEDIILATNTKGDTFLHRFLEKYSIYFREELVINFIKSLKENVSDDIFKKLLRIRNHKGETFLQVKNWYGYGERLIECCNAILGESLVEELLN